MNTDSLGVPGRLRVPQKLAHGSLRPTFVRSAPNLCFSAKSVLKNNNRRERDTLTLWRRNEIHREAICNDQALQHRLHRLAQINTDAGSPTKSGRSATLDRAIRLGADTRPDLCKSVLICEICVLKYPSTRT